MTIRSRVLVVFAIIAMVGVCMPTLVMAQEVASLTGVVTDPTGAVVAGAAVKLVDTKTNASYQTETNGVGAYTFTKLQPGPGYKLTVSKEGFRSHTVDNIYLGVDATHTQNAQLVLGQSTEMVEVNGSGSQVSLDTTDTTVSSSLNMGMVHELPLPIRDNPLGLLVYSPGVTSAPSGDDNTLGSRDGAVTGSRSDQSNYTLDGLDTNDFGTGEAGAMTANAPVDSVQEMRTETANPLSAEGRGSGAQVQMVTKSGTNNWHGSAYEYNRTAATTANDFFNNRQTPVIARPQLTRNQFGASLGGPIVKDKLFFFFNYEGRRDARSDLVNAIVPLDSFRAGNVAYINNSQTGNNGGPCTFTSRINTTPDCISTWPASNTSLDPQGIGPDQALLTFINSRYPRANDLTSGDGVNTGGFRWNSPVHFGGNDYVSRIDYNLNSKMKLFGRVSIYRQSTGDDVNFASAQLFPGDPVSNEIIDHSWAFVIGHTWTISNTKVNQFNFGETRSILNFPALFNPTGTTQYTTFMPNATNTSQLTAPFTGGASQKRTVPIPVFKDDFTYVRGKHNIQVGGTFKPIKDSSTLVNDFNNVTIGLGQPVTSLGAGNLPPDILTPSGTANRTWSQAYTFALGRIANVSSLFNNDHNLQPVPQGSGHTRNYRYYETELYAQDTWRMREDLTMTYGLRWQYYSVPYEINGFQTAPNIDFATMYNQRAQAAAAGISGDDAIPAVLYNFAGKANHTAGYYHPDWRDFQPRLSFAYNPSFTSGLLGKVFGQNKTVIRAGAGIVNDHTILSAINFFNDQTSFVFGQTVPTVFTGGLATDPRFTGVGQLPTLNQPQPVSVPFTPYLSGGGPFRYNGLVGNLPEFAIDPNYKTPYSETITFGIQRELPGNFLMEATYFGRFGHRLLSRGDAGQVVDFVDTASGQHLVDAFTQLTLASRNNQPIPALPFFDNVITPTLEANYGLDCPTLGSIIFGAPSTSCADLTNSLFNPLPTIGDMGDTFAALYTGIGGGPMIPANVGLDPQFASQLYFGNKSYSNYNGLLTSLHKKMSHGLQFDINYTFSHSIDNSSTIANNATGTGATGGYGGFLCDAIRLRSCRGNSDFDITDLISADGLYDLPFGKGRRLGGNASGWVDRIIGGWQVAFLNQWHTGFAFTTVSEAFPVSFNANSPAVFIGKRSDIKVRVHNDPASGQIQLFADPTAAINAFTGPIGLQGPTRNNLRGPRFSNTNLSLNKHLQIRENYGLEFRAEAYNAFNQVNFALPIGSVADINNQSTFGVINSDAGPRVMQFSLRFDF
ncbi:MAG TPA: carboxypeptidase-like regulatory domain-containing protein [Candidatus Dormibacteraeota bacterium]|nr:carboxypeptidase-like regulatory domain-containing protein [Candidatus Dormibacteraeota bacterium]